MDRTLVQWLQLPAQHDLFREARQSPFFGDDPEIREAPQSPVVTALLEGGDLTDTDGLARASFNLNQVVVNPLYEIVLHNLLVDELSRCPSFHRGWTPAERLFVIGLAYRGYATDLFTNSNLVGAAVMTLSDNVLRRHFSFLAGEELEKVMGALSGIRKNINVPEESTWAANRGDSYAATALLSGYARCVRYADDEGGSLYTREVQLPKYKAAVRGLEGNVVQDLLAREATSPEARRQLRALSSVGHPALADWKPIPAKQLTSTWIAQQLGWTSLPQLNHYRDAEGRELNLTLNQYGVVRLAQRLPYLLGNPNKIPVLKNFLDPLLLAIERDHYEIPQSAHITFGSNETDREAWVLTFDERWKLDYVQPAQSRAEWEEVIAPLLAMFGFVPYYVDRRVRFDVTNFDLEGPSDAEFRARFLRPTADEWVLSVYDYDIEPEVQQARDFFLKRHQSGFPEGWKSWKKITVKSSRGPVFYTLVKDDQGQPYEEGHPDQIFRENSKGALAVPGEGPDDRESREFHIVYEMPEGLPVVTDFLGYLREKGLIPKEASEEVNAIWNRTRPSHLTVLGVLATLLTLKTSVARRAFLEQLPNDSNIFQILAALHVAEKGELPQYPRLTWDEIAEALGWKAAEGMIATALERIGMGSIYVDEYERKFQVSFVDGMMYIGHMVKPDTYRVSDTVTPFLDIAVKLARAFPDVKAFAFSLHGMTWEGRYEAVVGQSGSVLDAQVIRPPTGGFYLATNEGFMEDHFRHRLIQIMDDGRSIDHYDIALQLPR